MSFKSTLPPTIPVVVREESKVLFDHTRNIKHRIRAWAPGLDDRAPHARYPITICRVDLRDNPDWCMEPTICRRNRKHQGLPECPECL